MARIPNETLQYLGGKKRLSPKELEFMQFIWEQPEGISSEEIYAHFQQSRSTKGTVLASIAKKGYVENQQKGLHHYYTALVTRKEYEQAVIRQQLMELSKDSSLLSLITAFSGKERLTDSQQKKVQELLEELKKDVEIGEAMD